MRNAKSTTIFLLLVFLLSVFSVQAQNEAPILVEFAEYPRIVELDGGTVTIHHPKIEDWQGFSTLSGWIAIEVLEKGADQKWIGSVRFEAQSDIDFDERLVVLHDGVIRERNFSQGEPTESMKALAEEAVTRGPRSIMLDVLLRSLPEDFEIPSQANNTPDINFNPPRIVVSTSPVQLMFIDGEPIAAPIEGTDLEFLVNTNWDVIHDKKKDRWYVLNNGSWQVSNYLASGFWETTTKLPKDIKKLPADKNWEAVQAALPAKMPEYEPAPLVVSLEPTELILLDGEAELVAIEGTSLRQVANTKSDLFELAGQYYYLASGRWFSTADLEKDWVAVGQLPEDFALIPPQHEKGHVLASVPGTADARAALIEANIPRSASISKDAGAELSVEYAGDPQFVDIEGTELTRAVNTPYQIIAFNKYYYLCHNAVWYFSLKAEGPWTVASNVPSEIYEIPATDPAHNVTYVYIEDEYVDDDYVNYNYTSGYTGMYSTSLVIVYGSGWYYNPYSYYRYGYPYYWHYPPTYGHSAWYNPATGAYGQRSVGYGPYGGVSSGAVYNPRTGSYARGQTVWDNDEVARRGYGYNPRNDSFAAGNMYYDFDENEGWRHGYVERGDNWVYGETTIHGDLRSTDYETSRGVEGNSTRQWNGDEMTGSGTFEGENRSGTTSSRIDDEGASLSVDGSAGGNLDVSKNAGESGREISGNTADGTGFSGETQRTDDGGFRTDLESDAGGSAVVGRDDGNRSFAGQSAEGDLYAGHNGNVYKKSDDGGWSQFDNGDWSSSKPQYDGGRDSGQSRSQLDNSQLNHQYDARQSGQRNYNNYQTQRGYSQGSRQRGGGRSRR